MLIEYPDPNERKRELGAPDRRRGPRLRRGRGPCPRLRDRRRGPRPRERREDLGGALPALRVRGGGARRGARRRQRPARLRPHPLPGAHATSRRKPSRAWPATCAEAAARPIADLGIFNWLRLLDSLNFVPVAPPRRSQPADRNLHENHWRQARSLQRHRRQARLQPARGKRRLGVRDPHREELPGQVEGHLLLAEGLHLRLPDRDRRLRQARQPSSRSATRSCSAARPTTSSPSSAGAATTRTCPSSATGASATRRARSSTSSASATRPKAWRCARPSSSTPTTRSST